MEAPAELAAFLRREQPRLVRAVDLLLNDHAVAEEIAQETLLRVASRWEKVSRLASPGGWTHRVAINLATSQLRRRQAERRARARLDGLADGTHGVQADDPDPQAAAAVRRALATLSSADRRRLVLRHVLEWTAGEIADLEGATPEVVRQRLRRARQALRDALATEAPDLHLDIPNGSDDGPTRTTHVHEETSDVR